MNLKNFKNFILTFTLFSITILVFALPVLAEGKVQRQYLSNKDNLSEPQKKISTDLLQLINNDFVMEDARQFLSADSIFPVTNEIIVDDLVYVYIYLKPGEGTQVISSYDLEVTDRDEENHFASAWVKVKDLETIASLDAVRAVRTVLPPVINMGSVVTEGDGIHRTSNVRSIYSQSGSGMKIGVISNGVRNISSAQASDDLPAGVTVLSDTVGGDEGTAMLEIIYDMVPETDLYFHDCGNNTIAFNSAIDSLVAAGCQVIVDDVGWITEPFFEDGIIASHIASILDDDNKDIIYISSAGNAGQEHYQGTYYEYEDVDSNKWYDFSKEASATTKSLYVDIPNNGRVRIVLQWDDEFGKSENDYDLYLSAVTIGDLGSGENTQDADGNYDPLEYIDYTNSSGVSIDAQIDVLNLQALGNETLEVFIYTSGGAIVSTDNISAADSIFGHPAVPGVIATGAIDAGDSGNDNIESFSSQGPVTIKYPLVESREKPDLCGIDGVTVTGAGGFPSPFSGTSAAAPHIAAIAAQIWGQFSDKTGDEIRNILITSAIDLGDTVGFDTVYGYGRADALNALEENLTPTTTLSGTPPEFTNLTTADITLGGTGVTHYEYKLDNGAYSEESLVATHINLSGLSEGSHTICVIGKNSADTWQAEENPTCYSWTIDTIKPTVSVTASSGPVKAGQVTITLNFLEQGVGLDTGISPVVTITGLNTVYTVEKTSFADTTWTGTFTLLDENEEKTAIISVAGATDLAGNVMDTDNSAGTFEVDTKEPTAISVSINSGAVYINTTSITLTISALGASQMKITGDITDSFDWTAYATSTVATLTSGDEEKNITVFFKDEVSNETQVSDSIILDQTNPQISSATASSDPVKAGTVTIILNFLEEQGLDTEVSPFVTILGLNTTSTVEQISYSGTTWQGTFTLLDENEEKTATISVAGAKDLIGNVMDDNNSAGTFEVDTITPSIDSVSPAVDATEKEVTTDITVIFSEEIDSNTLEFSLDSVSGTTNYADKTFTFTPEESLSYDKEYTAKILVKDIAGNLMDEFIWSFKTKKRSYSGGGGGSSGGASTTVPLFPEGEEEEEEEEEEKILEVTPTKEIIPISQGGGVSITLPEKTEVSVEIPPEAVPLPEAETPEILAEIETTISPVVKTIPIVSEPVSSIPEKKEIVGNYIYDFSSTVGGTAVEVFEKPVTLTFTYTDEQIEGLDEETLTVNYWDKDFLEWIVLPTVVDRENNIVTATTTHFTYYIVMADIIIEEPIIPEIPVVEKKELPKKEPVKKLTIEEIKLKIIEILTKLIELFIQLSRFVEIKE